MILIRKIIQNCFTLFFYTIGSLKFSCNGHDRVEPPVIVTPTSSTASPHTPKYLELIYDENEDPISILSDGYEIPINDSTVLSSSPFSIVQNSHINNTNSDLELGLEKERTFSSSSTVSEHSTVCANSELASATINPHHHQHHQILKVALPNSKEDCSSNEALLLPVTHHHPPATASAAVVVEKVKPFYTNAKIEEVFNCDGKTMM